MIRNALSLIALTGLVSVAAVAPAAACCGCAYTYAYSCVPPPQVQIWGIQPGYVVNQGPVYTGPGFYTSPTFEGELLTGGYPGVGYYDPFDSGPYDPFRHQLYNPYWPHLPPEHGRFRATHRIDGGVHRFAPRVSLRYQGYGDPRLRYR